MKNKKTLTSLSMEMIVKKGKTNARNHIHTEIAEIHSPVHMSVFNNVQNFGKDKTKAQNHVHTEMPNIHLMSDEERDEYIKKYQLYSMDRYKVFAIIDEDLDFAQVKRFWENSLELATAKVKDSLIR